MDLSKFSVNKLRTELWICHIVCEQRCLRKATEWADDLICALPEEGEEKLLSKLDKELASNYYDPKYDHARACFDLHQYDRAADLLRDCLDDDKARFLHYFSMYKAAEKKRIDLMNEVSINLPKQAQLKFNELRDSLERSMDKREPDGWLLYVYGLVLRKFRLKKSAITVIVDAINLTPVNWSAWYYLTSLVDSKQELEKLKLPNHLFKVFFNYMMRIDFEIPTLELWDTKTKSFLDKYFKESPFVKTLAAKAMGTQAINHQEAIEIFSQIREDDPYRVDGMDIYSNSLFVKKMRKELAKLAYDIEKIDPFTTETNCCIANSYSAREQHMKAIVHFTRALRLNPDHLNSWTLIGHEYLEMKMFEKAYQAYMFAITINKRDCRAWLGLGNHFETLMSNPNVTDPNYDRCLYYYSQVGKYRPNDQFMFMALSTIFEKMNDIPEAIICIKRAGQDGLHRLARLNGSSRDDSSSS